MSPPRRALLSVSDKTGLIDFARPLWSLGFELVSTGGTARALREASIAVREVSEVTGFPEILAGRVKTLHPKIHGGILARREIPTDMEALAHHGISPIEVVVVNLYPFAETVARPGCALETAIEEIDIGGPSLLRAAAKNYKHVTVLCEPSDYGRALEALRTGGLPETVRFELAAKVFAHTARYDMAIAAYLARQREATQGLPFPPLLTLAAERVAALRYGENPHQQAAFYRLPGSEKPSLAEAKVLQGKELSYNNLLDLDAALGILLDLPNTGAVVIKHTNPCGAAISSTLAQAYRRAREADAQSAFGGIVGLTGEVDGPTARLLVETFLEAVIAPSFSAEALEVLAAKKNLRVVAVGDRRVQGGIELRRVRGGLLVQEPDRLDEDESAWRCVTKRTPTDSERRELGFAWRLVKHVKSNAVLFAAADRTLGIGAGQMSRVDAVQVARMKADALGHDLRGSVLASDAFFPFPDGLIAAAEAGATAVIQPGGSVRDSEVIAAANERKLAMVFTGMRHFRH